MKLQPSFPSHGQAELALAEFQRRSTDPGCDEAFNTPFGKLLARITEEFGGEMVPHEKAVLGPHIGFVVDI